MRRAFQGRAAGVRSGLEEKIKADLEKRGVDPGYESVVISYTKPARESRYTPDFCLPNGILIETKGLFTSEDRQKHRVIAARHPGLDIRFVFGNAYARLNKQSPTTYAKWAETYGFQWAHREVPAAWLQEPADAARLSAIAAAQFTPKKAKGKDNV